MEKMIWEKPEMNDIAFGASEYVATCYAGVCDIDAGKTGDKITVEDDYYEREFWELQGEWKFGNVEKDLYRLFFAWNDSGEKDGIVQWAEVDMTDVVNDGNTACDKPFNAEGDFRYVASPDTFFYQDTHKNGGYTWKPVTEINSATKWTSAYHFYSGETFWDRNTHLCSVLNESGKS